MGQSSVIADRAGTRWTDDEDEILIQHAQAGDADGAAKALGRTPEACGKRLKLLGEPGPTRMARWPKALKGEEVRAIFGLTASGPSYWLNRGQMRGTRTGRGRGLWRIEEREVYRFIREEHERYSIHIMPPSKWRAYAEREAQRREGVPKPVLSVAEVARLKGSKMNTVTRAIREGHLPAVNTTPESSTPRYQVRREDALRWPFGQRLRGDHGRFVKRASSAPASAEDRRAA